MTKLPDDMEARTPAPEGEAWRTVPVEPTPQIQVLDAAQSAWTPGVSHYEAHQITWSAMLAASPVVPVGSGEEMRRATLEAIRHLDSGDPNDGGLAALVAGKNALFSCSEDPSLQDARGCFHAMIDALLAALRPTDTGWRDIATHDGSRTSVLVVSGGVVGEAYRDDESGDWWWANQSWGNYHAEKIDKPTHWMPLPPAPTDTGREA